MEGQLTHNGLEVPDILSDPEDEKLLNQPAKRKRIHNSASDSSILDVLPMQKSQASAREAVQPTTLKSWEGQIPTLRKKLEFKSSGSKTAASSAASPSPRRATFEKRARYKTREHRYDPKKRDKIAKQVEHEKISNEKKGKRGHARKAIKVGQQLMQKFSSKSIGQERLTVISSKSLHS